jgi:transposase-like protein
MSKTRQHYPKEFKTESVELLLTSGKPAKEIGNNLGIDPHMLHKWKRDYLADKEYAFPGNGKEAKSPEKQKIDLLQKQLIETQEERDILKKALGIFSKVTR